MQDETYKLIYFNARGRAEQIRFLFAFLGIKYQDERISREKWQYMKTSTPFGKLPILEINGHVISQSNAISRYIGKKYNLTGDTIWDELQCDILVEALEDIKSSITQFCYEQDPITKEEKKAKLIKEMIPLYLKKFDQIIAKNNGFAITWADFVLAVSLESFENIFGKAALKNYPSLKNLKEKIFNIPEIMEWVEKRPVTET